MDARGAAYMVTPPSESVKHPTWGVRATVKLKGIDGGPHKRRNMWFNSMIREEPYPGLKCD